MTDYDRARARALFRCEKCGNEGPQDDICNWCPCGSTVEYEAAHSVRRFHGRFTKLEPSND